MTDLYKQKFTVSTPQMDEIVVEKTELLENIFCRCPVCQKLESEDTELLAEFIQQNCTKHSLSVILKLSIDFMQALRTKKQSKLSKENGHNHYHQHQYDFDDNDIIRHVLYCVSTKNSTLRGIVCNVKSMQMLLESQTIAQTATAIKLLQSSQPANKVAPSE